MTDEDKQFCGYVAILGRPNVGKSTLLNKLLGQKISITSRKPQTTRHRIIGIDTKDDYQTIFVDTPGVQRKHDSAIHRYMNRAATSTIEDVDAIILVVDRLNWTDEDEYVVQSIRQSSAPVILAINKVDHLVEKNRLLPHIQALSAKLAWADVVPVAAKTGYNLEPLQAAIRKRLPARAHFYDAEQVTDRSERFLAAEIVREKIMRMMGDELPHKVAVEIEQYKTTSKLVTISAVIWVERDGQKKILIGVKGEKLKLIGSQARADIEVLVDQKVMLKLWVKVKGSWSDDERMLKSLGYADQ
ncbi:GTPase Era [Pseudomonadales bacterium]|jgi:GTP-binding protein Era|nr:GTPase Era [Pseudomonadales bacterium]MDA8789715.1 GTPase Era [Pseudomonadales bacterium]MDA8965328.1 GTPase Era [Pseudomonadales bacterium]MDB4450793.1 GTPase Era [Pseudomonadales bacterium]